MVTVPAGYILFIKKPALFVFDLYQILVFVQDPQEYMPAQRPLPMQVNIYLLKIV